MGQIQTGSWFHRRGTLQLKTLPTLSLDTLGTAHKPVVWHGALLQ